MGKGVGINAVGSKMLEHLAHHALACGDIPG
jgi:hypothetical protein